METVNQNLNNQENNGNDNEQIVVSYLDNLFNNIDSINLYEGVEPITEEEFSFMNSNVDQIKLEAKISILRWIKENNNQNAILGFLKDNEMLQKIKRSIIDSMLVQIRVSGHKDSHLFVAHQKMKLYGDVVSKFNNFKSNY